MSKNVLLISTNTFKELSAAHSNTDERFIRPEIKAAQDIHLMPVLKMPLYYRLINLVELGTLDNPSNDKYKQLVDYFIKDALVNFILSELPDATSYQFTNKGVKSITGEGAESLDYSILNSVKRKYKNRGDFYAQRMVEYLDANYEIYPDWKSTGWCGNGNSTYTSPIAGMGIRIMKSVPPRYTPKPGDYFPYTFPFVLHGSTTGGGGNDEFPYELPFQF